MKIILTKFTLVGTREKQFTEEFFLLFPAIKFLTSTLHMAINSRYSYLIITNIPGTKTILTNAQFAGEKHENQQKEELVHKLHAAF